MEDIHVKCMVGPGVIARMTHIVYCMLMECDQNLIELFLLFAEDNLFRTKYVFFFFRYTFTFLN